MPTNCAAHLTMHPVLKGWLFTSVRFAASKLIRRERLRRTREERALAMQEPPGGNTAGWEEIRPLVDQMLAELKERERDALLLRFFEGHGYAQIGARLCIGEDAARMRIERALEHLRIRLSRRGITSTTAALVAMLTTQASIAAPTGLLQTVSATALTHAGVGGLAAGRDASSGVPHIRADLRP